MEMNARLRREFEIGDPEVGHFLHARASVVKKEQQGAGSRFVLLPFAGSCANSAPISSRSRNRVSLRGARLVGIVATRSATAIISGTREARYSKKL